MARALRAIINSYGLLIVAIHLSYLHYIYSTISDVGEKMYPTARHVSYAQLLTVNVLHFLSVSGCPL